MTTESPRILLADDEDTFRRSTAKLMEQEGYQCDCAQDSDEASRLLTNQHDVLVSDIRMPGNMQFEFLRDIRMRFPLLPIVLVTGYPSVQTAVESIRLSFTDYLLKPVDWPDLLRALGRAVKKSRVLRMTTAVREEAGRVAVSIDRLQELMSSSSYSGEDQQGLVWPLETFLAQSFAQMAMLSSQVCSVMEHQAQGGVGEPVDVCRAMNCPRLSVYREALTSAVEVLEQTKIAFRSKDLGLLRGKIEQVLKEDRAR